MPKEQIPDYLALLRDPTADDELKIGACWTINALNRNVDRRRVVPAVIALLESPNAQLRQLSVMILGHLDSKRAIAPLLYVATNRDEIEAIRIEAIHALNNYGDERIGTLYLRLMHDTDEDVRLRSLAIEWVYHADSLLDTWVAFLADPLPDIRFWAAFRLSQTWATIPANALAAVDHVAAFDHTLPTTWGWHVDREAFLALETMCSYPYRLEEAGGTDEYGLPNYSFHLVSAAAEYNDFLQQYRRYNPDLLYDALPMPPVDLRIDPDWLQAQIAGAWADASFNVRHLQTYALDWHIRMGEQNLLGGLHRDGYAIVLSGRDDKAFAFAAWLRGIIAPEHKLYIYEWADVGIELTPGISASQIDTAYYALDESRRNPGFYATSESK